MKPSFRATGFALALVGASLPALAAPPAVATKWRLTGSAQNECALFAGAAMAKAGFEDGGPTSQSRVGRRGEYTASIRCVTEQRMVFFVVSGPDPQEVARLIDRLYDTY